MTNEDRSWDRKYRPTTWESYIGNEGIKTRLSLALEKNKLPQSLMLEGPRGTGKTTMARLLSKSLKCLNPQHGVACGVCNNCKYLDDNYILTGGSGGSKLAIEEIDITKMNSVDDAKAIIDRMTKVGIMHTTRVFILDEMQRASKQAQSAYLKVFEEPIPNTYVIICTTDPQDLLDTIKSRLTSYKLVRPKVNEIVSRLSYIAGEEGVKYTAEALRLLVAESGRITRESVKHLESIATSGDVTMKSVEEEFGLINEKVYVDFLNAVRWGRTSSLIEQSQKITDLDLSIPNFINGLGNFLVILLNAKSGVEMGSYSLDKVKKYRKLIEGKDGINVEQLMELLKLIKQYSNVSRNEPYYIYSLAIEAGDIFDLSSEDNNIDPIVADAKYTKVTKALTPVANAPKRIGASDNDITSIFGNATMVDTPEEFKKED